MSKGNGKITSKNLHYSSSLPPFLARLRGDFSTYQNDGPDPILSARRRPTKPRSGSVEAEDAPLVVDDEGNIVSHLKVGVDGHISSVSSAGEALAKQGAEAGEDVREGAGSGERPDGKGEEEGGNGDRKGEEGKVAVGGGKKRKMGKIVGAQEDEEPAPGKNEDKTRGKENGGEKDGPKKGDKKKVKKLKLSFGDDEG